MFKSPDKKVRIKLASESPKKVRTKTLFHKTYLLGGFQGSFYWTSEQVYLSPYIPFPLWINLSTFSPTPLQHLARTNLT